MKITDINKKTVFIPMSYEILDKYKYEFTSDFSKLVDNVNIEDSYSSEFFSEEKDVKNCDKNRECVNNKNRECINSSDKNRECVNSSDININDESINNRKYCINSIKDSINRENIYSSDNIKIFLFDIDNTLYKPTLEMTEYELTRWKKAYDYLINSTSNTITHTNIKSNNIKSNNIKSNNIKSNNIKSDNIKFNNIKSNNNIPTFTTLLNSHDMWTESFTKYFKKNTLSNRKTKRNARFWKVYTKK
ncbi:hypothetical protein NAPIS_ORF00360 [Vairimorpha apis BRL 01]|uniref:Uncharacterized protein n=1 Tax=Vairimorpha apis BRL 01 TaxID=1037528 RepID=T0MM28_9MICR|nr:hypothetical protein NAPIS_ORF00360 [Vairimorpha apis BRL 01]